MIPILPIRYLNKRIELAADPAPDVQLKLKSFCVYNKPGYGQPPQPDDIRYSDTLLYRALYKAVVLVEFIAPIIHTCPQVRFYLLIAHRIGGSDTF